MKIAFKDKKVRALCETRAVAERKLGAACAKKLAARLGDLDAAGRVTDLVAGNPHPLKGRRTGQFALEVSGGWRMVFIPDQWPCPVDADGAIEWSEVTIVCVEYIGDYHD
ncbi:MAG: killer suppression protein HigA [Pseudomonadota bacterium]